MKIFITGGNGQIAYALKKEAALAHHEVLAPDHSTCDITDFPSLKHYIIQFKPDVVVNTAAYTQVDQAELESDLAFAVNREGAKNVAIVCDVVRCPLIHLSTDYVFDGEKRIPYTESDPLNPLNIYGLSKAEGEAGVREYCENHMIIRVSAVFGTHGYNFVKTILRLAKENEHLRIVADQITCPTPALTIAKAILHMISSPHWGTYHYSGVEAISWFQFAQKILALVNCKNECLPIKTDEYPQLAKRPLYSVLDCHKIENTFGMKRPNWEIELREVIDVLCAP